jgi:hypothetical protein
MRQRETAVKTASAWRRSAERPRRAGASTREPEPESGVGGGAAAELAEGDTVILHCR